MNNYETRAGVPKPQLGTPQNWTFEQNTFFCRFWNLINMIQKINSVKHNFKIMFFYKKKEQKSILKYPIYMHFSRLQNSPLSFIVPSCRMRPFGRTINYLEVLLQIHNFNLMLLRAAQENSSKN